MILLLHVECCEAAYSCVLPLSPTGRIVCPAQRTVVLPNSAALFSGKTNHTLVHAATVCSVVLYL